MRALALIFTGIFFVCFYLETKAEDLSPAALYNRCYSHLTNKPAPRDQRYTDVLNGVKDPIDTCIEVFDKARIPTASNTISNQNDTEAQDVIRTFQHFHLTWFLNIGVTPLNACHDQATQDINDPQAPSNSLSRALFKDGVNYSNVLTDTTIYDSVRINGRDPEFGPITRAPKSEYMVGFRNPQPWADVIFNPTGVAVGFVPTRNQVVSELRLFAPPGLPTPPPGAGRDVMSPINGGGILSSPNYLLATVSQSISFRSDGAMNMPRSWAKSVFHDFLCRDLPVIRNSDAQLFVVKNPSEGTPAFRTSSSCTTCHASMDRMAGVMRNFRYAQTARCNNQQNIKGISTVSSYDLDPTKEAESKWPTEPDIDYAVRPTNGVFYFRTHDGKLINQSVSNITELANTIASVEDYYICAAKRYYKLFTNVDVSLGDYADPAANILVKDEHKVHQERVVELGKQLQSHQDLSQLVKDILKSNYYKAKGFSTGVQ